MKSELFKGLIETQLESLFPFMPSELCNRIMCLLGRSAEVSEKLDRLAKMSEAALSALTNAHDTVKAKLLLGRS